MKRNKGAKEKSRVLRVWTYAEAQAVIPYISSVVRSLREHALDALACHRRSKALADRPGRPDRTALIARQDAERDGRRAEQEFLDAAAELEQLDVFSLDPTRGQALIPFVHQEQLAWYIFDLFDAKPFRFWRFQTDPEDTRRPITAREQGLTESTRTV
jgi:hypothetical protein